MLSCFENSTACFIFESPQGKFALIPAQWRFSTEVNAMTTELRSLTNRFSLLVMCAVFATGCSHTPYSPTGGASFIASALVPVGALRTVRMEMPDDKLARVCPGNGRADCEANWQHLQEGATAAEVAKLLGQPAQQTGPDIYIEKVVEQWQYGHNGVVYFENEELRYVETPTSFEYYL